MNGAALVDHVSPPSPSSLVAVRDVVRNKGAIYCWYANKANHPRAPLSGRDLLFRDSSEVALLVTQFLPLAPLSRAPLYFVVSCRFLFVAKNLLARSIRQGPLCRRRWVR